ncbi:MAG TPA: SUMF1/EgtB/PvdO family nonheme iron enzyme, partial [Verrucomicrobium sp.]|nr:SUMF1/EgtB/PvdO family nonheme iron enzyme [Verrucomicrobium sp.]
MSDESTQFQPAPDASPGRSDPGRLRWNPPTTDHMARMLPQYADWETLGMGGMGAVYKARQLSLDRWVAIKVLPPEAADDESQYVARFKNEARTMARLSHPAIVAVHDSGETADGQLYFAMEYVDGTDVARLIQQQGKLPPDHALAVAAHVCDALLYAHEQGVIHRDIKPANVLINRDGQVKVADFGLAKLNDPSQATSLTRSDMAIGTPDFVAPESLTLGMTTDHRADLYAVGVMLYNMLTGEIPRGMFKLPSLKVGTDRRFDDIITRAMENDPRDRYQSSSEIRHDLDHILTVPFVKVDSPASTAAVPKNLVPEDRPPAPKPSPSPGPPQQQRPRPVTVRPMRPRKSPLVAFTSMIAFGVLLGGGGWYLVSKNSAGNAAPPAPAAPSPPTVGEGTSPLVPVIDQSSRSLILGTREKPFVNSLGQEYVFVSGAKVHFCRWETRVKDYRAFLNENKRTWQAQSFPQTDDHPAVGLTWLDASFFCEWLSRKEDRHYRLPTDVEWSFAVGVGDMEDPKAPIKEKLGQMPDLYPWGKVWPPPKGVANLPDETALRLAKKPESQVLRGYDDGFAWTSPVGTFPANALGLHDLSGNVWEWCSDWFDEPQKFRVLRGGSYDYFTRDHLRSTHRTGNSQNVRTAVYGFRIVLAEGKAPPPSAALKEEEKIANAPAAAKTQPQASAVVTVGSSKYQFVPGRISWADARTRATAMGGHLAVVTSAEEQSAIASLCSPMLTSPFHMLWLGAVRTKSPNTWQWVTGEPFEYSSWAKGNPSSDQAGDWLTLMFLEGKLQWNDFEHAVAGGERVDFYIKGYVVEWEDASKDLASLPPLD